MARRHTEYPESYCALGFAADFHNKVESRHSMLIPSISMFRITAPRQRAGLTAPVIDLSTARLPHLKVDNHEPLQLGPSGRDYQLVQRLMVTLQHYFINNGTGYVQSHRVLRLKKERLTPHADTACTVQEVFPSPDGVAMIAPHYTKWYESPKSQYR